MESTPLIFSGLFALALLASFLWWRVVVFKREIERREEKVRQQMYELAILKEVGDRVGYSLNIKKIADVIVGSLSQFMGYSVAAYMLFDSDKVTFKADLKESVSKQFVSEVKEKMKSAFEELLGRGMDKQAIETTITGVVTSDANRSPVNSFFNIPLVVGGNVLGVITVAHTQKGLYKEQEMTLLYKIVAQATRALERLEDVIKTEQGKLGAMVESMPDGIMMTDGDYRVIIANPAVREIIGVSDGREVTIFDFIDGLSGVFDIRGKLEESVSLRKTFVVDNLTISGKIFQVFVSPVTKEVDAGKRQVLGGLVVFHDVTDVKEAEKMREEFTSMIVHELRSPLDGIKKMGEFMRTDTSIRKNDETFNEYIGMIYKSSSQMLELVNDLLDVAKIESGKFDVQKVSHDIRTIIDERIRFYAPLADELKIKLVARIDKSVPGSVEVDPNRIAQVLNNLISNAIKFTPPGGTVSITAILHKRGNSLVTEAADAGARWFVKNGFSDYPDAVFIGVTDTGPGIPADDIKKLFNKFVQVEAAARSKKKGTGLGLVVAKGIVDAHGGVIGVDSEVGVGSTFYFTIRV